MKRRYKNSRPISRRIFLRQAGGGAVAVAAMRRALHAQRASSSEIPPHHSIDLPGVHAYPMEHSVAPGEMLELCVSASVAYRLSICRLGRAVDDPSHDQVLYRLDDSPANPQPIHPGSYVHVEQRIEGKVRSITLECWVRPWDLNKLQGLISQEDKDASDGFALGIGAGGYVGFYLGDDVSPDDALVHRTKPGAIEPKKWHHVAATWDGKTKRIYVDGAEVGAWAFAGPLLVGTHALRIGSMSQGGIARHFLDGDVAMPSIYSRALTREEVRARFEERGINTAQGKEVLACWPLSEERGERVADASVHKRDGRIINHGTWMIGGPSFRAEVPRFGGYDPKTDTTRGHGLRLASDDLYDCRWRTTHRWEVPRDARSGIYVARMEFTYEAKPRIYHCTFIVRRAPRRPKAPILLMAATNTWRAYSGTPFTVTPPSLHQVWGTGGLAQAPSQYPSFNLYRDHATGQGSYQVGLRMPWPAAGPYVLYGGPTKYSHLMRADRFPQVWLEEQGYEYDVVSDVDLHRDPALLRGYKAFLIVGHNEYWSLPMYRGLDRYLRGGGNVVVLSGNTLFWRVSFNEHCSVMECRKVDAAGARVPASRRGEAWHSHDGLRGGMMRECGYPGVDLIALDCLGFNSPSAPEQFGPYIVEDPDHFLFNRPERTGVKKGDSIGRSAAGVVMANAHEFDIRPSTFAKLQELPSPEGGIVPPDPPNIQLLANGQVHWKKGGSAYDYFFRKITPNADQGGEVIYWERPEGGRVFNAGAIGSGWVLHADPKWAAVVRNVLAHFGVEKA